MPFPPDWEEPDLPTGENPDFPGAPGSLPTVPREYFVVSDLTSASRFTVTDTTKPPYFSVVDATSPGYFTVTDLTG